GGRRWGTGGGGCAAHRGRDLGNRLPYCRPSSGTTLGCARRGLRSRRGRRSQRRRQTTGSRTPATRIGCRRRRARGQDRKTDGQTEGSSSNTCGVETQPQDTCDYPACHKWGLWHVVFTMSTFANTPNSGKCLPVHLLFPGQRGVSRIVISAYFPYGTVVPGSGQIRLHSA